MRRMRQEVKLLMLLTTATVPAAVVPAAAGCRLFGAVDGHNYMGLEILDGLESLDGGTGFAPDDTVGRAGAVTQVGEPFLDGHD